MQRTELHLAQIKRGLIERQSSLWGYNKPLQEIKLSVWGPTGDYVDGFSPCLLMEVRSVSIWGFPGTLVVRSCLPMQETSERWAQSLGRWAPLEEGTASRPSLFPGASRGQPTLAGRSPCGHRVRHVWGDSARRHARCLCLPRGTCSTPGRWTPSAASWFSAPPHSSGRGLGRCGRPAGRDLQPGSSQRTDSASILGTASAQPSCGQTPVPGSVAATGGAPSRGRAAPPRVRSGAKAPVWNVGREKGMSAFLRQTLFWERQAKP